MPWLIALFRNSTLPTSIGMSASGVSRLAIKARTPAASTPLPAIITGPTATRPRSATIPPRMAAEELVDRLPKALGVPGCGAAAVVAMRQAPMGPVDVAQRDGGSAD